MISPERKPAPRPTAPRVLPFFVSGFSCPVGCTYCSQRDQTGVGAPLNPEAVRELVRSAARRPDPRPVEVAFYGGTFTALPAAQQRALLAAARPSDVPIAGLRVSTHPRWTDADHLALLRDAGVDTVEVGVQSLDDAVLAGVHRGVDAAGTLAALGRVRDAGLRLGVQLMVGLPGADRASDRRSAEGLTGVGAALARVYPTLVMRGSRLATVWREGGYEALSVAEAIVRAADQTACLEDAGVLVQRIGLHEDEQLRAARLAGPTDPAFGERVRSELAYRRLRALASKQERGDLVVRVSARRLSQWTGQRRENLRRFAEDFPGRRLDLRGDEGLAPGEIGVDGGESSSTVRTDARA